MKKLFTLFAVAMIAIGANAQTLIAEKDFTGIAESALPDVSSYCEGVNAYGSSDANGIAITVESQTRQTVCPLIWLWRPGFDALELKSNGCYKMVVTAKFPTDGRLVMSLLSGDLWQSSAYVNATGGFQEVEVDFPIPPMFFQGENCGLMIICGDFIGTTILKKVQLYEMEDAIDKIDDISYFLNKDNKTAVVAKAGESCSDGDIRATITHDGEVYTVTKILGEAFNGCPYLTSVTIPNTVTEICGYAFNGCNGIKEITIPASVKVISSGAFRGCYSLKRVIALAETPPLLSEDAFDNIGNVILKVPDDYVDVYKAADPWNKFNEIEMMSKEKCEKPTVSVDNGKLNFSCATEGVEYHYEILASIKGDGNGVRLPEKFKISVYASKDGFYDSAIETSEIPVSVVADANGDGVVDAADIVKIVNIIMGK